MNTYRIGKNAGRLWDYLKENGECTMAELKKELKINNKELYMALGWLARKDNIAFYEKNGEQYIFLLFI